jgi:hypothetical protein
MVAGERRSLAIIKVEQVDRAGYQHIRPRGLLAIDDLIRRTIDLRVKMRNLQHAAACLRCKQERHDAGSREIEWTMIRGERLLAAVSAAEDKLTQTRDTLATQLSLFEK